MHNLKIALVQTHLHWEDVQANLEHFSNKLDQLQEVVDLAIIPEMFTTGFAMQPVGVAQTMDSPVLDWFKSQSTLRQCTLCGSVAIEDGGKYYNRTLWVEPNGSVSWYDKRHLFAYGGEDKQYSSGTSRVITKCGDWRVLLQICYDLRFPVFSRNRNDYDCVVYCANWPTPRRHAWNTLLTARAIENQVYSVGINRIGNDGNSLSYSGDSAVYDPLGQRVLDLGELDSVAGCTLSASHLLQVREEFPFLSDADQFEML